MGTNRIISGPAAAAGPRLLSGEILDKNQCNLLLRDVAMLKGSFSSCWRGSTVFAQMADVLSSLDEDHFKVMAYRKAAKVLADYPVDVKEAYRGAAPYHSDIIIDGMSLCDTSRL
jgi:hypothetical protein